MSVKKAYESLNDVQKAGIAFIRKKLDWSNKEIAVAIGYRSKQPGNMVTQVENHGKTFGGEHGVRFSRLCDDHGFSDVADWYCGTDKSSLPVFSGEPDLCTEAEHLEIYRNGGLAKHLEDQHMIREALNHAKAQRAASDSLIRDLQAKLHDDRPVRLPVLSVRQSGDGI